MSDAPSLGELIDMQIRANGPISIATYMGLALTHPRSGYYTGADPLGTKGDFITAPEISQMFGELIGFYIVNLWQQLGQPKSVTLLELGPGRGTLMQDALRVAAKADGFIDALHLQLFETNPALKAMQAERLAPYNPYWASEIDAVADDPLFVVANEFFDALPVRQFVKGTAGGWHERLIGLRDGTRAFGLSPTPIPEAALPAAVHDAPEGAVYEVSLAAADVLQRLGNRIAELGGGLLAIDYGYETTQTGETLQAIRQHAFADPLESPGDIDLSAHVDFGALATVAAGLGLKPTLTPQRDFLGRLGIVERASALAKANPGQIDAIAAALRRLTDSGEMGTLFKVFAATGKDLEPIGFSG